MSDQIYYEDVEIGAEITEDRETVTPVQMFFFSAATYNGHRIHYDKPYATEAEGHPDILVQGPLQSAFVAKTVTDWAGPRGRLVKLSVQNRASAYPGEELRIRGHVVDKQEAGDDGLVEVVLQEESADGRVLMPATATVRLPRRR